MMRTFGSNNEGSVGILFGLAILPLLAAVGASLEYSRATDLRAFLQLESDVAALAIAASDTPNTDTIKDRLKARALTSARQAAPEIL